MTKKEWLDKVLFHKDVLIKFINNYHPCNLSPHDDNDVMPPFITAPQAERACEVVRNSIRKESFARPDVLFNIALQKNDSDTISKLLSETWTGVPETTHCWQIPGFRETVDLIDDPVEAEDFG